jgi:nicotinamide-nucleotide amidase
MLGQLPTAAIITVGDELVLGEVADTNAAWLAGELSRCGVDVQVAITARDQRAALSSWIRLLRAEHAVVVVSGGLGGTPDDVTRDAVAEAFQVPLVLDRRLAASARAAGGYRATFAERWYRFPRGSVLLEGAEGGAPAFRIESVFVLPGSPIEMKSAFPAVRDAIDRGSRTFVWRETFATSEDRILQLLEDLVRRFAGVEVGSYARHRNDSAEVELVLRAHDLHALTPAVTYAEQRLNGSRIARAAFAA